MTGAGAAGAAALGGVVGGAIEAAATAHMEVTQGIELNPVRGTHTRQRIGGVSRSHPEPRPLHRQLSPRHARQQKCPRRATAAAVVCTGEQPGHEGLSVHRRGCKRHWIQPCKREQRRSHVNVAANLREALLRLDARPADQHGYANRVVIDV
eukprot:COSAG06_NODE_5215_length_3632_cov_1.923861_2_plen_152_part_00